MKLLIKIIFIVFFVHPSFAQYTADSTSLIQYRTPEWFKDAKFGIYFHWGPYSVPAYDNEWYSRNMYVDGSKANKFHLEKYGDLKSFGYKDFIPYFTAENFNAHEWVNLFAQAGAQFVGPVAEHADGFAMWDSDLTKYDAVDMGPRRDIVGEMAEAVKSKGLKFIATYHRHWLYAWYPTWDNSVDARDSSFQELYGPNTPKGTFVMADKPTSPLPSDEFNIEWLARLIEIVNKYHPDLVWFDNKMDIIDEKYRLAFLSYYYNQALERNQEVVCTYKFHDLPWGTAVYDLERARMSEAKDFPWLTDDSVDWDTWSHTTKTNYKSTDRLVDFLIDVVSKNGCVLLNVTPKANGEIPNGVKERLLEIGKWLDMNGEAIYGSRPWNVYGEGDTELVEGHLSEIKNPDHKSTDIRFTQKDGFLYAISLGVPKNELLIRTLSLSKFPELQISTVEILGLAESKHITWTRSKEGLKIKFPDMSQNMKFATVFKLKIR